MNLYGEIFPNDKDVVPAWVHFPLRSRIRLIIAGVRGKVRVDFPAGDIVEKMMDTVLFGNGYNDKEDMP